MTATASGPGTPALGQGRLSRTSPGTKKGPASHGGSAAAARRSAPKATQPKARPVTSSQAAWLASDLAQWEDGPPQAATVAGRVESEQPDTVDFRGKRPGPCLASLLKARVASASEPPRGHWHSRRDAPRP